LQIYSSDNVFAEKIDEDILQNHDLKDNFINFVENFGEISGSNSKSQLGRESNGWGIGRDSLGIGLGRESMGTKTIRHIRSYYQTELLSPMLSQQIISLTTDLIEK